MLRLRRQPVAGLFLVAALVPLLGAGPVLTCGDMAVGHHEASHASAGHGTHADGGAHAACPDPAIAGHGHAPAGQLADSPEEAPPSPPAPCCSLGMTCAGAGLTTRSAAMESGPVLLVLQLVDAPNALHSTDSELLKRPPRA